MPIEYEISIHRNVTIARWSGDVEIEEYRTLFGQYVRDQNYVAGRPKICDFSAMTSLDADFAQIWSVLTMANGHEVATAPATQCVIYAPDDTQFGLGRIYQSLAENAGGLQVTVCRTELEVLAHLELPDNSLAELHRHGAFLPPCPRDD